MAEATSGFRAMLSRPGVYELWSRLVGGERSRGILVREYVRPWPGARVLDLGCGPGDLVRYLSGVEYVGVDRSEAYIERARRLFGDHAEFRVGDATRLDDGLGGFDLVLAFGLVHHLDDESALRLFEIAAAARREGGRLVTVDPALEEHQHWVARYVIERDLGQNVRTPREYTRFAETAFPTVKAVTRSDLLRIPYTHCVLECSGTAGEND